MVDRANVLSQISALLDNELPENEALTIKKHLLRCKKCREEFEILKKIDNLLNLWDRQATESIKTSDSYEDRLCLRIKAIKKRTSSSNPNGFNGPPVARLKP